MTAETITGTKAASTAQARSGIDLTCNWEKITISSAIEAGDKWELFKLPKGATPVFAWIQATDLDTHATPTLTFDLGYSEDTDTLIDGATTGQAAIGFAGSFPNLLTAFGTALTAEKTVVLEAKTGPATGASSGTIFVCVFYSLNQ